LVEDCFSAVSLKMTAECYSYCDPICHLW